MKSIVKLLLLVFATGVVTAAPPARSWASFGENVRLSKLGAEDFSAMFKDALIVKMVKQEKRFGFNPGRALENGKERVFDKELDFDGSVSKGEVEVLAGETSADIKHFSFMNAREFWEGPEGARVSHEIRILRQRNLDHKAVKLMFEGYFVDATIPAFMVSGVRTFSDFDLLAGNIKALKVTELCEWILDHGDLCALVALNELMSRREVVGPQLMAAMLHGKSSDMKNLLLCLLLRENRLPVEAWREIWTAADPTERTLIVDLARSQKMQVSGAGAGDLWNYYEAIEKIAETMR